MLNRSQVDAFTTIRNRAKDPNDPNHSMLSKLPDELIREIGLFGRDDTEFNQALRLAASGEEKDIDDLVKMIKANPKLLLQSGHVMTGGGIEVRNTTLYGFFLGSGDPEAAARIQFGFAEITEGEKERSRQYNEYKPHIDALAKQLELNQPDYDLEPLINLILSSSSQDVTDALNKNYDYENNKLHKALKAFREAVTPPSKIKTPQMHYQHYTTIKQALNLLYDKWEKLSNNDTNYDKCRLVWRQIVGYLHRGLPAVDRFAFARAFNDKERTVKFKCDSGSSDLTGVGYVRRRGGGGRARECVGASLENMFRTKTSDLQNLCSHTQNRNRPDV